MNKELIYLTPRELKTLFETKMQSIVNIALNSHDIGEFKVRLLDFLLLNEEKQSSLEQETIMRLIHHDGMMIKEASTEEKMKLDTITNLWHFLREKDDFDKYNSDFLIDIYKQFENLNVNNSAITDKEQLHKWMNRWPSGREGNIVQIRERNKQRIINHLINRIDQREYGKSKYSFPTDISLEEKREMVGNWWNDYRFHLSMAARSFKELNNLMGGTLSEDIRSIYQVANKKGIPIFVTPYYASLMDIANEGFDDSSLRSYVLYSQELVDAYGNIKAWEREDRVEPGKPNVAGWILPEGHNIHRRYPEVAILIPDTIGRACGGLCASCQRLYEFQSGRFNFDLEALKPDETWDHKLKELMKFFREDEQLCDILITGGDALMTRNKNLRKILEAVYVMAKKKRKDNKSRAEGEKYSEIRRVRLGTRLPVYLPMRIDDELISILSEFKEKAASVGISQFFIQTHFQSPLEITPEVCEGIRKLHSAGWSVTNQLVFNVAASRRGHTSKLREELNKIGVLCYYTFSVKGFKENHSVFTPNSRSLQEQEEEKIWGKMNDEEAFTFMKYLNSKLSLEKSISLFQKNYNLPFLSTDRNVMNLPGIGKSMTFRVVGIMSDGCRMLAFDHDHTRKHSPSIKDMPIIYIKENKSIAKYLRQLSDMGENVSEYDSIWLYNEGHTEPRFPIYEYPI